MRFLFDSTSDDTQSRGRSEGGKDEWKMRVWERDEGKKRVRPWKTEAGGQRRWERECFPVSELACYIYSWWNVGQGGEELDDKGEQR